jgi:hypothetical protein
MMSFSNLSPPICTHPKPVCIDITELSFYLGGYIADYRPEEDPSLFPLSVDPEEILRWPLLDALDCSLGQVYRPAGVALLSPFYQLFAP